MRRQGWSGRGSRISGLRALIVSIPPFDLFHAAFLEYRSLISGVPVIAEDAAPGRIQPGFGQSGKDEGELE
jgi:hypothetical protein